MCYEEECFFKFEETRGFEVKPLPHQSTISRVDDPDPLKSRPVLWSTVKSPMIRHGFVIHGPFQVLLNPAAIVSFTCNCSQVERQKTNRHFAWKVAMLQEWSFVTYREVSAARKCSFLAVSRNNSNMVRVGDPPISGSLKTRLMSWFVSWYWGPRSNISRLLECRRRPSYTYPNWDAVAEVIAAVYKRYAGFHEHSERFTKGSCQIQGNRD